VTVRPLRTLNSNDLEFLKALPCDSKCYLFGSSLDDHASPRDTDILIVYHDAAVAEMIDFMDLYEGVAIARHVDLTPLTVSEERQVGFISLTGARAITL
jgi:predicted nucleotidyltransferase